MTRINAKDNNMTRYIIVGLTALYLTACAQPAVPETHPIISAYSQAYNDKDIETMSNLMHPDIEWVAVEGIEIDVHVSGKDTLTEAMQGWFENPDLPKGSLRDWSDNGDYVAVTETASWTDDTGTEKSQSALTVYELEDRLIRRVYYYPAATG
jgi:hypothetical protein